MQDFRFAFLADCQLGCYATFSGLSPADVVAYAGRGMTVVSAPKADGWAWDQRRLGDAITALNSLQPAFAVVGGDMIDDPAVEGQYEALRRTTSALDDIPLHWVPGNHDCAFDFTAPTPESLAHYRARFGSDTTAFDYAGVFFVTVNTVVLDHPEAVESELDRQLAFLESSLRDARSQGARSIVVFGHHPLFTAHRDEPDSYWNIPQPRRALVLDLLKAFGVRAYFSGHWHRNGGGWDEGLEVVVSGPVGYPLGDDPSGFRLVTVAGDTLTHEYVALRDSALVTGA